MLKSTYTVVYIINFLSLKDLRFKRWLALVKHQCVRFCTICTFTFRRAFFRGNSNIRVQSQVAQTTANESCLVTTADSRIVIQIIKMLNVNCLLLLHITISSCFHVRRVIGYVHKLHPFLHVYMTLNAMFLEKIFFFNLT